MGEVGVAAGAGRRSARRAVVSIVGFWLLGVLGSVEPWGLGFVPFLGGMVCGFVFFYAVSEMAAEGTGWRLSTSGTFPATARRRRRRSSGRRAPCSDRAGARLVESTAWPRALVWSALALPLAVALLSVWRSSGPFLGSA